jgi:hypothetical protein
VRTTLKWIAACFAASFIAALAAACSSGQGKSATEVSLAQLSAAQESYNGKQVSTSGTVREFSDSGGTYYVLENAEQDRVALEPADEAAPYAGQDVTVAGRFTFGQETGRRIELTTISATAPTPTPSGAAGTSDVAQPGGQVIHG